MKIDVKEYIEDLLKDRKLSKSKKKKLSKRLYCINRIEEHKEIIKTKYDSDSKGHACNIKVMNRKIAREMAKKNPDYNNIDYKYSKKIRKSLAIKQAFDNIYKPLNMSGYNGK